MSTRFIVAGIVLPLLSISCADAGVGRVPSTSRVVLAEGRPATGKMYRGAEVCRSCHALIYDFWSRTGHARSYRILNGSADMNNPSCLRCHTTGYGERTGFADVRSTPGLAAVTCESCHGPSGDHADSRHPSLVSPTGEADCSGCDVDRVCRLCHTVSRSPRFQLARGLDAVSCRQAGASGSGTRGRGGAALPSSSTER